MPVIRRIWWLKVHNNYLLSCAPLRQEIIAQDNQYVNLKGEDCAATTPTVNGLARQQPLTVKQQPFSYIELGFVFSGLDMRRTRNLARVAMYPLGLKQAQLNPASLRNGCC